MKEIKEYSYAFVGLEGYYGWENHLYKICPVDLIMYNFTVHKCVLNHSLENLFIPDLKIPCNKAWSKMDVVQ